MQPHIEVRKPQAIFIEDLLEEFQERAYEMGRDGEQRGLDYVAMREKVLIFVEMLVDQSRQSVDTAKQTG